MRQSEVEKMERLLEGLIKKLKRNTNRGDIEKIVFVEEAKTAIRKVQLLIAISGDIQGIKPIKDRTHGCGWEIIDNNGVTRRYFQKS